jgi:hypothetical protein
MVTQNILPLKEALSYVSKYHIKTLECWRNFISRSDSPDNLPVDPEVYGLSSDEFFGSIPHSSLSRAKEYAREHNLKSLKEWSEKASSDSEFPPDLPKSLKYFTKRGWTNATDFFGGLGRRKRGTNFVSFEEAREWARNSSVNTAVEWLQSTIIPENIPKSPYIKYSDKWISWPDFLGTGRRRSSVLLPYVDAEKFAQESLATTVEEWKSLEKPDGIAKQPQISYKEKGWVNWEVFLGTSTIEFTEFQALANTNSIKNLTQWHEFRRTQKNRKLLPRVPTKEYNKSPEECFGDRWVTLEEAKKFVQETGISSVAEWYLACDEGKIPFNIPKNLHRTYKNKGWKGAYDFFGTSKEQRRGRRRGQHLANYDEVREWCSKNNVKNKKDWTTLVRSGTLPSNFTKNPQSYFKSYGTWVSWEHLFNDENN